MNKIREQALYLLRSIIAGVFVGIGGCIYLSATHYGGKFLGAALFSLALIMILAGGYKLYTSRIAYVFENKLTYVLTLLLTLVGNFIGTSLVGLSMYYSDRETIKNLAQVVMESKLSLGYASMVLQGFWCGVMIWIGVEGSKRYNNEVARMLVIIMAITIFIIAEFEHCIANLFYIAAAGKWSLDSLVMFIFVLIGNSVGAWVCWGCKKLCSERETKNA